jgi:hypothetical protein
LKNSGNINMNDIHAEENLEALALASASREKIR